MTRRLCHLPYFQARRVKFLYAFQPFVLTTCILQSWDNHPLYCVLFDLGAMSYSLSLYGLTSFHPFRNSIPVF
jgi:hypothetical protein